MSAETTPAVAALAEALRPYQLEGVSFLLRNTAALLADEMGLGKTVQAIAALQLLLRGPNVNRALIVAPASLGLNWQATRHAPTRDIVEGSVRVLQRPRWIAMWGFLWASRPYAELTGLADMPQVRHWLEMALGVR